MLFYLEQVLIAIDQLFNALLGGYADETLSAKCHRQRHITYINTFRIIINAVFFWQTNHCYESYLSEVERKQLPKVYRK